VEVRPDLPTDAVAGLTEAQRIFLRALADAAETEQPATGDAWQDLIFRVSQEHGVSSGDAFGAIYAAVLGRSNGPRAGWLLASLDRGFVTVRLREAAEAPSA
jgi:lysyl-tRNA synthetase class 1